MSPLEKTHRHMTEYNQDLERQVAQGHPAQEEDPTRMAKRARALPVILLPELRIAFSLTVLILTITSIQRGVVTFAIVKTKAFY